MIYIEEGDTIDVRRTSVDINGHISITGQSPEAITTLAAALLRFARERRAAEEGS